MPATDPSLWRRFLAVALPVFRSEVRWKMWGGLGLVLACLLGINGLNVSLTAFCAQSREDLEGNNSMLLSVVAIGRKL